MSSKAPGRLGGARFRRARRIATCTALVLSVGALISVPASAEGRPPAPNGQLKRITPDIRQPTLTLPPRAAKRATAAGKGLAATARTKAKPRFDLNGDGLGDLLYRGQNGAYYLVPSDGSAVRGYDIPGDGDEMFKDVVPIGDQDGSGKTAILTLSSAGTLGIRQSGMSGAGSPIWSGKGWQEYNKLIATGDLTGNGRNDLLARTPSGELYLYASNGRLVSPFTSRVKIGGGWQVYDQIVGVNDANGDGYGDLYARTPAGDLYFYAGTGNAVAPFKPRVKVGYGYGIYNQLLSTDDADGDGYGDLLARTPDGQLFYYSSDGTGQLRGRVPGGSGWNVASLFAGAGGNPYLGKSEVLGLDTHGTLYYYYAENNGKLSARQQASDDGGWLGSKPVFASSLDHDGRGDLLDIFQGTLYNYSRATDSGPYSLGSGWGIYTMVIGPGDLDNDGKGDLLARDGAGNLYLYRGDGAGYGVASRIKVGAGWNAYDKIVGAGDLTGDGLTDIVARTPDGTLYLYEGTGVATAPFKPRVSLGGGWNQYKQLAAPGDLDGDGRADLLATDSHGDLYSYLADGTGKFKPRQKIGNGWNTYASLH
ncbi:FG-GAP repeat domain-containing protein [Streptomyces celluloflavus]|uniref:FG-GAP repeat domain-containing protein n=1 Tax=Streptomyces celluloflavus TaxID=58344 RepID=UPI00368942C9